MGLSKDDIEILEGNISLEPTSTQKRRHRRRILKAAKAGTLDTTKKRHRIVINRPSDIPTNLPGDILTDDSDDDTFEDIIDENAFDEPVLNKNKKIKHCNQFFSKKNKSQNPICDTPNLKNNQKSASGKSIAPEDFKPLCQHPINNNKSTPKVKGKPKAEASDSKNDENDILQSKLVKAEDSTTTDTKKPKCDNFTTGKKQKSKSNNSDISQPSKTEDLTVTGDKRLNVSNNNQKQNIKEVFDSEQQEKLNGNKQNLIDTLTPEKLLAIVCHSAKAEDLKKENQEPVQQQFVPVEEEATASDKEDMETRQNAKGSQKSQQVLNKKDTKSEDSTSTISAGSAKSRDDVKAAREAKKLAKQQAKKKADTAMENVGVKEVTVKAEESGAQTKDKQRNVEPIKSTSVAQSEKPVPDSNRKENIQPSGSGAVDVVAKKGDENNESVAEISKNKDKHGGKSKAELKAVRRALQETQRAIKLAAQQASAPAAKEKEPVKIKEEKPPKPKSVEKSKLKVYSLQKVSCFQHLNVEKDKDYLKKIPINSNLHPAVVKLGVQLESQVIRGANARTVALLDAIKKMVRDYSLPAHTEAARGLQAQLAAAEAFLSQRRAPAAPDRNALKHLRRALTLLPPNITEYDAKSALQEEIDRYIREQIDMAGEAISLILRTKISSGDHILTYGCSSLIERALVSAWESGVCFRTTVAGARGQRAAEMLRRLRARGLPAYYADLAALGHVMEDVQKVLLGAGALFAHGAALGAAGSAQAALLARARNVPVLVACETHKFSERTALDPLAAHEMGDPDELIDETDENSPLREWRSNPRLTLLNVTHDVTPPCLISAVVTELGILPCTSAPVVLRFKQAEYGM